VRLGVRHWVALRRGIVIGYLCVASIFAVFNRWQWTAISAAEELVNESVSTCPPAKSVEHVFFINLPFVNIYAKPALDLRLGSWFADVRCHVLTFSPDAFLFDQRCTIEPVDAHGFTLAVEGRPYFAGLLGRFMLEGFSTGGRLQTGYVRDTGEFRVEVLEADEAGVHKLLFRFRRPLSDPAYQFYLTSAECGAAPLRFHVGPPRKVAEPPADSAALNVAAAALRMGNAGAGDALLACAALESQTLRSAAIEAGLPVFRFAAGAMGGPHVPEVDDVAAWSRFADWWRASVTDQTLAETWLLRDKFAHWYKQREEVPHARMWASKVIRTDLYLTGPPFPGPR